MAVFLIGIISLATSWWGYSSASTGSAVTVNFLPGSNYAITCAGHDCGGFTAGSFPYTAIGGSLGTLYEGVLILLAAAVALVGLAALFTGLEVLRQRDVAAHRSLTNWFLMGAALLFLGAVGWTAAGQPAGFPAGTPFAGSGSGGSSPATSFWGSTSNGGASWGAGPGWYLALIGAVLVVVVLFVLLGLARQHSSPTPERRTRSAVGSPSVAPRGYTAPPSATVNPRRSESAWTPPATTTSRDVPVPPKAKVPAPVAATPGAAPEMIACPDCGTQNLAKSRVCSYCQRRLRP
ncbi:MAG: hypothetical protein WB947_07775 [Thermoplasmata archaeon]